MELLRKIENRGYPTEYLLSRIKGRRDYLIKDWRPLIFNLSPDGYLSTTRYRDMVTERSAEGVWRYFQKEFNWVYFQMNKGLHNIFRPFFQYTEINTILFSLRYKAGREDKKLEELLSFSLLSEELKNIIMNSENIISAVEGVEDIFASLSDRFRGIKKIPVKFGLKEIEQRLTNIYLEHMIDSKLHPVIREYFISIIDLRNIVSLYKYLWWDIKTSPHFIRGGSINPKTLGEAMDSKDIFRIGFIIKKLTGIKIESPDATNIENCLLRWIKRSLVRVGRETSGIGLILDYLWKCYLEVRNLRIIMYSSDIDREVISAELIN